MVTYYSANGTLAVFPNVAAVYTANHTSAVKPAVSTELTAICTAVFCPCVSTLQGAGCTYGVFPCMFTSQCTNSTLALLPVMFTCKRTNCTCTLRECVLDGFRTNVTSAFCIVCLMLADCRNIGKCKCIVSVVYQCEGYLSALGYKEFFVFAPVFIEVHSIVQGYCCGTLGRITVGHIVIIVFGSLEHYVAVLGKGHNQFAVYELKLAVVLVVIVNSVILAVYKANQIILGLGSVAYCALAAAVYMFGTNHITSYTNGVRPFVSRTFAITDKAVAFVKLMFALCKTNCTYAVIVPFMLAGNSTF